MKPERPVWHSLMQVPVKMGVRVKYVKVVQDADVKID